MHPFITTINLPLESAFAEEALELSFEVSGKYYPPRAAILNPPDAAQPEDPPEVGLQAITVRLLFDGQPVFTSDPIDVSRGRISDFIYNYIDWLEEEIANQMEGRQ